MTRLRFMHSIMVGLRFKLFAPMIVVIFTACRPDPMGTAPRLLIVAEDRPEDLRFLTSPDVGIAFIRGSVDESGQLQPRTSALRLPDTRPYLIAIYRPAPSANAARAAQQIAKNADEHFIRAILIEAPAITDSLRDLLHQIKPRMRSHQVLGILTPASNCPSTDALKTLDVEEVAGSPAPCPGARRRYLFSPAPWTAAELDKQRASLQ